MIPQEAYLNEFVGYDSKIGPKDVSQIENYATTLAKAE